MRSHAQLETAIERGAAALVALQADDGSFPMYWRDRVRASPWKPCASLFSTAGVVLAVPSLLPPDSIARAATYIAGMRRADGLWEFDASLGVPPDVDDTSCALAALARHGKVANPAEEAALIRSFWRPDGGPFQTWRGSRSWSGRDRDDPVVNCNVLFTLAQLNAAVTQEEIDAVRRLIRLSVAGSRYYCVAAALAYAARRTDIPLDALPPAATARPLGGELLPCIFWLCSGGRDPEIVDVVLAAQGEDGAWPVLDWCQDGGARMMWGSPAFSTAAAIEGLMRYASV